MEKNTTHKSKHNQKVGTHMLLKKSIPRCEIESAEMLDNVIDSITYPICCHDAELEHEAYFLHFMEKLVYQRQINLRIVGYNFSSRLTANLNLYFKST